MKKQPFINLHYFFILQRCMRRPADGEGEDAAKAAKPLHQLPPGGDRDQAVRHGQPPVPGVAGLDDSDAGADLGADQRVIKLHNTF